MSESGKALKAEIRNYYYRGYGTTSPSLWQKMNLWIYHFGMHCVIVYRFGRYANEIFNSNKILGILLKVIYKPFDYLVKMFHHVDIDAATIGQGLYIGHVGTILIGPCKIGRNFCVTHNVTIGLGHEMAAGSVPTIGENVWVGTGSVITGAIKIGDRVTIASGSILSRDIPDDCLVGGNPARILLRNYSNCKLIIESPCD
jgi:serine O-acetyltransferase